MTSPAPVTPSTPSASAAPLAVRAFRLVGSFACMGLGVNVFLCVARGSWSDAAALAPFAVFLPLLALSIWVCRQDFVHSFTSPQGRATLLVIVQGGLGLLVLCFALYILGYRFRAKADFTSSQMFSLSEETKLVLAGLKDLDRPIEIFYLQGLDSADPKERDAADRERARVTALLREYQAHADALKPGRLVFESYNLNENSLELNALSKRIHDATQFLGGLEEATVFLWGERIKIVRKQELNPVVIHEKAVGRPFQSERVFTDTIRELLAVNPKAVYFSTGHGERDVQSCAQFRGLLKQQTYAEKEWKSGEAVPSDAAMVIVLGPRDAFSEKDAAALRAYLVGGGRLLLFFDPLLDKIQGLPREGCGLDAVLNAYGLQPRQDVLTRRFIPDVLGGRPIPRDEVVAYPRKESDSVLLETLKFEGQHLVTTLTCAVQISAAAGEGVRPQVVLETPPYIRGKQLFWADPIAAKSESNEPGPNSLPGPVPVAAASEGSAGSRIVAVAGSNVAVDQYFMNYDGNRTFLLAAARWLAGEDELVTQIQPKSPDVRVAKISPEQSKILMVLLVLGLPVAVFFAGMIVWAMRRT
ncbi:MAG: GldG family protein [Planctomycetes bacterium]|nr:GldG family protein [Planctomycetota bacterium]